MTAPEEWLTTITVNCTAISMKAMRLAAEFEELSHTDVINRALQLYASVVTAKPGTQITLKTPVGGHLRIIVPREGQS